MGLRPARGNEESSSSPRKRGPIVRPMDSRLRGNDVISEKVAMAASPPEGIRLAVILSEAKALQFRSETD